MISIMEPYFWKIIEKPKADIVKDVISKQYKKLINKLAKPIADKIQKIKDKFNEFDVFPKIQP